MNHQFTDQRTTQNTRNSEVCPACWMNTSSTVQMGVWMSNPDVWVCSETCRRQAIMDNAISCPRNTEVWNGNSFVRCGQNGVVCSHCENEMNCNPNTQVN